MTIDSNLTALQNSGLIQLATLDPELEYLFRHALVQDAAYSSLLRADQRHLHRLVGEVLEDLFKDKLSAQDFAALLAEHFAKAGEEARALHYFALAGDLAADRYANAEAVANFDRAITIATTQAKIDSERLKHLFGQRGRALELSGHYQPAIENYRQLHDLAVEKNEPALRLFALMAQATLLVTPTSLSDPQKGFVMAEQALMAARQLGDRAAECQALWLAMLACFFDQKVAEASRFGEQSLAIARELNLRERLAFTLNDISRIYLSLGQLDRALAVLLEARVLWREFRNLPMLADNLGSTSEVWLLSGRYAEVVASASEGVEISRSIANVWGQGYCTWMKGYAHWEMGDLAEAWAAYQSVLNMSDQIQLPFAYMPTLTEVGWVRAWLGDVAGGLQLVSTTLPPADAVIAHMFRPWAYGVLARIHLLRGALAESEACLAEIRGQLDLEDFSSYAPVIVSLAEIELRLAQQDYAKALAKADEYLERLQRKNMVYSQAEALYLKGLALQGLHKLDASYETWRAAQTVAEATDNRRVIWKILWALSSLVAEQGQADKAQHLRQAARTALQFLIDHCPPDLKSSFLTWPDVQAVRQSQ